MTAAPGHSAQPVIRRGKLHCPRDETRLVWEPRPAGATWTCPTCQYELCMPRDGPPVLVPPVRLEGELGVEPEGRAAEQRNREGETMPELITVIGPNGVAPTPQITAPQSWDDLAAARLTDLLLQIRQVDTWRQEATRIHAALLAYGRVVDSLPWSESGQPVRTTRAARACLQCGRAFYPASHKTRFCSVSCGSLATAARLRAEREQGAARSQEAAG